jgi:uroporphyrinogen III methyltransferase/synthase
VSGTLADIAELVAHAGLHSPVLIVVGEVVTLREQLIWLDNRPLFGKRILVTRAREQASELSRLLREAGAQSIESPMIRTEPLPPVEDLITRLQRADWLIFTSANGLPALLGQLTAFGSDIRQLGRAKIAAIGEATAEILRQHCLRVDFTPSRAIAERLSEELPDPKHKHVVIIRAEEGRKILPERLMARGATVEIIPVYRTVADETPLPPIGTLDAITFTSSSTVRNFRTRYPGEVNGPVIACIGPITAQTAREMGLRVDIVAETSSVQGLVNSLEAYFSEKAACKKLF